MSAPGPNQYRCEMCQGVFPKGWTDADAEAELAKNFPDADREQCAEVCTDCYKFLRTCTFAHRWSGWPGAWCLDCGCEDPREISICLGEHVPKDHPGWHDCKEANSRRCDPYAVLARKLH